MDIGNTSAHFGLMEDGRCLHEVHLPTGTFAASFGDVLASMRARRLEPDGISVCSVVPKALEAGMPALLASGLPVYHLRHDTCVGLGLDYPNPSEIGQDRLANAIAAQSLYGVPAIVIDMGTAVTFDVVTDKGYAGGIIAPGLEVMTRYLHDQTALLPKLDPNDLMVSSGIGRSTIEAMKLGVAVGFAGMIRALLDRVGGELRARSGTEPRVVATGGSAGVLPQQWLSEGIAFEPMVTLLGLEEAYKRQLRSGGVDSIGRGLA